VQHRIAGAVASKPTAERDNVGCGDAYVALLLHGLLQGWSLVDSGNAASRWAAEVAAQPGATPIFDDELIVSIIGESGYVA